MRNLAIHQITMMEGGPAGLVRFAARAGLRKICLFTATPAHPDGSDMFPVVKPSKRNMFIQLMEGHNITIINAEYFPIMAGLEVKEYEAALTLAAALRAKRIVTHIHETDPARAEDQLGQLCDMADRLNLQVGLEFTGFAKGCDSLDNAVAWASKMGHPHLKIAVDALHLFRTGGTLAQLRRVDPALIGYAQICDGPDMRVTDDYLDEAMFRMIPGEGAFPLSEFVEAFAPHVDLDIEVPGHAGAETASNRAMRAIEASRNLLEPLET